jgi:Spy/CpxP family protein refolding chaperone
MKTVLAAVAAATLLGAFATPASAQPWRHHHWHHHWHHRHCAWRHHHRFCW